MTEDDFDLDDFDDIFFKFDTAPARTPEELEKQAQEECLKNERVLLEGLATWLLHSHPIDRWQFYGNRSQHTLHMEENLLKRLDIWLEKYAASCQEKDQLGRRRLFQLARHDDTLYQWLSQQNPPPKTLARYIYLCIPLPWTMDALTLAWRANAPSIRVYLKMFGSQASEKLEGMTSYISLNDLNIHGLQQRALSLAFSSPNPTTQEEGNAKNHLATA